jgi:YidC/Oxa1 family membrane protein insertase
LGLNYGYGPSSIIEWVFEHVHVYSGLPWWGTIMASTLLVRLTMFPLFLKSADNSAKMNALKPATFALQKQIQEAQKEKDMALMSQSYTAMRQIYKDAGVSMKWMFIPGVLQGVLGYCSFKVTRAMAALPVPGLETGGFAWITDLTIPDPYFAVPIAIGGVFHLVGRVSQSLI